MSIQRPQLPQDPYARPATVAYTPSTGAGFPPAPNQWGQQQQQQHGQQDGAYGAVNAYPAMPGGGMIGAPPPIHGHQQQFGGQQQQFHQQHQQPPQATPQPSYQTDAPASNQHRWSIAGQLPGNQTGQYGIPQGQSHNDQAGQQAFQPGNLHRQSTYLGGSAAISSPVEQTSGGFQQHGAPVPPPKPSYGASAQQPPGPPPQSYQYGQQQPPHQYHQQPQSQYQYQNQPQHAAQQAQPQAPPQSHSPQQNFHQQNQQVYGHQQQSSHPVNQFQPGHAHGQSIAHPGSVPPAHQPWQPPNQTQQPQTNHQAYGQQQQQQQQQPQQHQAQQYQQHQQFNPHQPGQPTIGSISHAPIQGQPTPYVQQDEPVSPILGARPGNSFDNSKPDVSRPTSHHLPSRSNSNISRPTPAAVASPPRTDLKTSSPVSAVKPLQSAFAPRPKKSADPNGIGSTGASALGMGGPSDWESFGPADYEVDDLELYSKPKKPEPSAPVELPAGSPIEQRQDDSWVAPAGGAVELAGGSPVATQQPIQLVQAQPPPQQVQQTPAGSSAPIDGGMIMTTEPVIAPLVQKAAPQVIPQHPVPSQPGAIMSPPASQSFVIGDSGGWTNTPQQGQPQQSYPPQTQPQQPIMHQQQAVAPMQPAAAAIIQAGWQAGQQQQQQQQQNQPPQHAQQLYGQPSGAPIPNTLQQHPPQNLQNIPRVQSVPQTQSAHALPSSNQNDFRELQNKYAETVSELEKLKEREIENRLQGDQSSEEVQRLNDRIARLQDECKAAQSEYTKLERSVEAMENASVTSANEKAALEREKAALLVEKTSWGNERTGITSKINELESALGVAKTENETTRADLAGKLQVAEAAVIAAKNDAIATSTGYQTKLKDAEAALSTAKSEIEVLKKQLEDEKAKPADPAPGLHEWYKGSLLRFRDTLKEEEAAADPADKMKKFQSWVNEEAKLRGIEMEFMSKPAPEPQTKAAPPKPVINTHDFVMVDAEPEQYSPGGRPIMNPRPVVAQRKASEPSAASNETHVPTQDKNSPAFQPFRAFRADSVSTTGQPKSGQNTPPIQPSERSSSLPGAGRKPAPPVIETPPPSKPAAYTPLKYVKPTGNELGLPGAKNVDPQRPQSISSISLPLLPNTIRSASTRPQEEIFLEVTEPPKKEALETPIVQDALPAPLKPKTPAPFAQSKSAGAIPSLSTTKKNLPPLENLRSLLPSLRMPNPSAQHAKIKSINGSIARFTPSDFNFIHKTVNEWETTAGVTRKRLDSERARRQAEAEEESSNLFHSGEIGYADIEALEEKKKLEEQVRQEEENDAEWNSFLQDVFGVIYQRLEGEIKELDTIRASVESLCHEAVAGQRALEAASSDNPEYITLTSSLDLLIRINSMIYERESELDKAVLDRDRRYKKNSTRALYRKGQIKKMKEQEAQFEKLERQTEIQQRHRLFKNCHMLLKSVKTSLGRGCNENEDYAKELLEAIKLAAKNPSATSDIKRATSVLSDIADNSINLMRLFDKVEVLLNDAEYEQEVAKERAQAADPNIISDLAVQKKKLDAELQDDAKRRADGVLDKLKEWKAEVGKVAGSVVVAKVDDSADGDEADKKRRMQIALEKAKKRNGDL